MENREWRMENGERRMEEEKFCECWKILEKWRNGIWVMQVFDPNFELLRSQKLNDKWTDLSLGPDPCVL